MHTSLILKLERCWILKPIFFCADNFLYIPWFGCHRDLWCREYEISLAWPQASKWLSFENEMMAVGSKLIERRTTVFTNQNTLTNRTKEYSDLNSVFSLCKRKDNENQFVIPPALSCNRSPVNPWNLIASNLNVLPSFSISISISSTYCADWLQFGWLFTVFFFFRFFFKKAPSNALASDISSGNLHNKSILFDRWMNHNLEKSLTSSRSLYRFDAIVLELIFVFTVIMSGAFILSNEAEEQPTSLTRFPFFVWVCSYVAWALF